MNFFLQFYKNNFFIKSVNYGFTLISIYFLFEKIKVIKISSINNPGLGFAIIFIFLIFLSQFSQAYAWTYFFEYELNKKVLYSWLNSNFAKYIPFKIGVLFKRYSLLKQYSNKLSLKTVSKKFTFEQIIIVSCSLVISISYFFSNIYYFSITFTIITLIFYLSNFESSTKKRITFYFFSQYLNLLALYILSFAVFNLEITNLKIAAIYTFSSILSLFIVTAPAGLGVREALFLYFLNTNQFINEITVYIVLVRVFTLISDLLIYFVSLLINKINNNL